MRWNSFQAPYPQSMLRQHDKSFGKLSPYPQSILRQHDKSFEKLSLFHCLDQ